MNYPPARLAKIERLGYTASESRFLYLVAVLSGYFLRRQFLVFVRTESGKRDQAFLDKAQAKGHVRAEPHTTESSKRYHLYARTFYDAIEHTDSSHRRAGSATRAVIKLLGLDLALAHPGARYLETEQEKVAFFATCGVPVHRMPGRRYLPSAAGEAPTERYFVDRFPIFFAAPDDPVVTFAYLHAGTFAVAAFATYLEHYRALLTTLERPWRVLFVSDTDADFARAGRLFDAAFLADEDPDRQILEYFRVRDLWEQGRRQELTVSDLVTRGEGAQRYASAHHEALYGAWLREGRPSSLQSVRPRELAGEFATYLVVRT